MFNSRFVSMLLMAPVLVATATEASKKPAAPLAVQADALLTQRYSANGPGAAVLVAQEGKTLFRKGYGLASVELNVPVNPEMVFRIGSATKQFTAAAVLLLAEEGKVDLKAPVSKYLHKTPKTWEGVTVEMLLNHTSGIPSYTNDPAFSVHSREDFTPEKLLETFVIKKDLDFEPGQEWLYNNTGYLLLGMIIEKVSGQPWDAFMKARIFDPLGMKHTRLGTETELIPGMVQGYAGGTPAPYLSMTQPGAAGALVSTVDDLAAWTFSLHGGKLLKPESLAKMLASTRTQDGKIHSYGFGLASRESQGHRLIGHGGAVNGFMCFLEFDLETRTAAVILNNTLPPKGADEYYSRRLLAMAAGKPVPEPTAVPLPKDHVARLAGRYSGEGVFGEPVSRTFVTEDGRLFLGQGPRKAELVAVSSTSFQVKDSDTMYRFVLEGDKVKGVHRSAIAAANGAPGQESPLWMRVEDKPKTQAAPLDTAAFDACAGEYELGPKFVLKFWREGDQLWTEATGQGKAELFCENANTYFLKVVDAKVVFEKGADGKVSSLVLHQGGQKIPAKRVK